MGMNMVNNETVVESTILFHESSGELLCQSVSSNIQSFLPLFKCLLLHELTNDIPDAHYFLFLLFNLFPIFYPFFFHLLSYQGFKGMSEGNRDTRDSVPRPCSRGYIREHVH